MKNLCVLVMNLGLLVNVPAQGLDTTDYFPLHVRDKWWTIGLGGGYWGPDSYQVTGIIKIRDTTYFVMDSISLCRKDSAGNVYQRVGGVDLLYYKLTAAEGEKWPVNPEGTMEMSLLVTSEDLVTPIGQFRNCKVFMLKPAAGGFDNDFFYTLAPGIGLAAYDTNPITDEHWSLRRALINGVLVRSPLHIAGVTPSPNEGVVDTAAVITFGFDSFVDTNIVSNKVRVLSKQTGLIAGNLFSSYAIGQNSRRFAFSPSERLLPMDTITVTISADVTDIFGEGLDGNGNGRYEGSPADDYSSTFYTQIVTGVEDPVSEKVQVSFSLFQNYPNPFNPSTTISYDLFTRSRVTLKIFNVLGQAVATLVDGAIETGRNEVRWDAAGLPSGVYFYRLDAEGYIMSRKMILTK